MVKAAEAITEPTLLVGPETIAISKPTSGADIAPDKATQKARPDIPSVNETMAIQDLVGRWKQAWSNKDIDAYLGYYSDIFLPKSGMSIEQWRRYRRVRLSKPKTIDIQIRDLQITQQGQTRAIVTFTQIYESNLFQDEIEKTLSLVKEENEWKIVSEKTRPLKSPAS
jgi:adhesin transport system outer membrane protein